MRPTESQATHGPADSVETCPEQASIFAVGSYALQAADSVENRRREGSVTLMESNPEDGSLEVCQTVTCQGGVLDLKWRGNDLISTESEGFVRLLRRGDGEDGKSVTELWSGRVDAKEKTLRGADFASSTINLSASFCCDGERVALSHDDCSVSVWKCGPGGLENESWWRAHDGEVWIVACSQTDANVLWTGADDCVLRGWDTRTSPQKATFSAARFDMGVTTMQHVGDHIWAVGSYDEKLRLFDDRRPQRAVTESARLGGGVWRVKHSRAQGAFALACMRGGFSIVEHESLKTLHTYTGLHESEALAYGVDWLPQNGLVACCSFYDARLSTFQWPQITQ